MIILSNPLEFEFFRRGLLAACLIGAVAGVVGTYVVLRGMSYIGHGLSHAVFGGAVVSYVAQANFYIGATVFGLFSAWLIHALTRRRGIGADAAIGVVTTASFALGVAIISRARRFTKNFEAALFGNILGVTPEDLLVIGLVCVGALVVIVFMYKEFLYTTFDRESAKVFGVRTELADALLSLLLAAVIIASMQVIGVTMLAAAIVTPAITARLLTERFDKMLVLSAVIGAGTAVVGLFASFFFNVASGAAIVLTSALLFAFALAATWRPEPAARRAGTHEHSHSHGGRPHFHSHGHPHTGDHDHVH